MLVWCVDDDKTICEIEVYTLRQMGFEARGFFDGDAMLWALAEKIPDLIVLDIMLPGKDGIAVLGQLRANARTRAIPVIMATAKGMEADRIGGLEAGADDYLVKPFSMLEMVSRVKAVLRRCAPPQDAAVLRCGEICLDDNAHMVHVGENPITLTLKEYALLRCFLRHPGTVLGREKLLSEVWGTDYLGESRTVDMHIKTLRRKLGSVGGYIETVIGVGYRLEAKS